MQVTVSGVGWSCFDYLFTGLDFNSEGYKKHQSRTPGDGGTSPGHLVFMEDLEKFSGVPLAKIRQDQGWDRHPDKFNIGGPCIVALINAAQLTKKPNVEVRLFCAFGNDDVADSILSLAQKTPLNLSRCTRMKGSSPYTLCLSDPNFNDGKGERCFVVNSGVLANYSPTVLGEEFFDSDILYFGATALTPRIHDNLTALLKKGKERGCINIVGTVFDFRNDKRNPYKRWPMGESDMSFSFMDLLVMDWDEAMKISGKRTIEDAIDFFASHRVKSVVVTHGHLDSYAWSSGEFFKELPLTAFPVCRKVLHDLEANPNVSGDTTGCGDNFAGGLIASVAESLGKKLKPGQLSLPEALAWGHASGGLACFYVGGMYLESAPGEKLRKVSVYHEEYKKQMELSTKRSSRL